MHFTMVDLEPIIFQKTGSLMLEHVSSNTLSKKELRKYYNEKNEEQTNPFAWQVSKRFQVSFEHIKSITEPDFKETLSKLSSALTTLYNNKPEVFAYAKEALDWNVKDHLIPHIEERHSFSEFLNERNEESISVTEEDEYDSEDDTMSPLERAFMDGYYREESENENYGSDSGKEDEEESLLEDGYSTLTEEEQYERLQDEYEEWKKNKLKELGDLSEISNLIDICFNGGEDYSWFINDIAEGSLETSFNLFQELDLESIGINEEIAETIFASLWFYYDWEEHDIDGDNYILDTYVSTLQKLANGKFSNIKQDILSKLQEKYEKELEQQEDEEREILGEVLDLKESYNNAFNSTNIVEVQKNWATYTKYQNFSKTNPESDTEEDLRDKFDRLFLSSTQERVEKYYNMKVYPHLCTTSLIYSSKHPEKSASLDLKELLGKVVDVGHQLEKHRKKGAENILVPILSFVVSTLPHEKGGKHGKEFISFAIAQDKSIRVLSKNPDDKVFKSDRAFNQKARVDYCNGMSIKGLVEEAEDTFNKADQRELNHSERVMIEYLRNSQNVKDIVRMLKEEIGKCYKKAGTYMVYTAVMVLYSTNTVCGYCAPSLISMQHSYEKGFLAELISSVNKKINNDNISLKSKGADTDKTLFKLHTIVGASVNYDSQAHDLADEGLHSHGKVNKAPAKTYNPNAKLYFPYDAINLNVSRTADFIYEFMLGKNATGAAKPFKFSGTCFISGKDNINTSRYAAVIKNDNGSSLLL